MGIQVQDNRIQTKLPYVGDTQDPKGQIVTNLDQLKIPDSVALQPQNVIPFLASQSARLQEITARPDFRSLEADIPEFHEGMINTLSNVSRDEMSALQSASQEIMARIQSVDLESQTFDPDSLLDEIDRLSGSRPEFPDVNQGGGAGNVNGPDVLDQMFQQKYRETAEERERFYQALALAKGNPASVNLVMGMRYANQIQKRIGKVVEVYAQHTADLDAIQRELTQSANSSTPPSQAQVLSTSTELSRANSDMSLIMQFMNKLMSDLERVTADTKKTDETIQRSKDTFIQNFKQ